MRRKKSKKNASSKRQGFRGIEDIVAKKIKIRPKKF